MSDQQQQTKAPGANDASSFAGRPAMGDIHDTVSALQQSKECCICGISVSGKKRFKDDRGKYWCDSCWQSTGSKSVKDYRFATAGQELRRKRARQTQVAIIGIVLAVILALVAVAMLQT